MEFDPFRIWTRKQKITDTENALLNLQAELRRKDEERTRIESQVLHLSEEIIAKDDVIYDLQVKVIILEQSVLQLTSESAEKNDNKNMAEFLKAELVGREKEVMQLTRERDMLNWKLIHEPSRSHTEIEDERNKFRLRNDQLKASNATLTGELDNLTDKIDILAKRNMELTDQLERRNALTDQLKVDFEAAIESRARLLEEVSSLKQQLGDVQTTINSSSSINQRRYVRGKSGEKLVASIKLWPEAMSRMLLKSGTANTNQSTEKENRPVLVPSNSNRSVRRILSTMSVKAIEKDTVRNLVRNIQSGSSARSSATPRSTPYQLVESAPSSAIESNESDTSSRRAVLDDIRDIHKNKAVFQGQAVKIRSLSPVREVLDGSNASPINRKGPSLLLAEVRTARQQLVNGNRSARLSKLNNSATTKNSSSKERQSRQRSMSASHPLSENSSVQKKTMVPLINNF